MVYTFEKIMTDNPYVDNLLYYAKNLAVNSTVKCESIALANETEESLYAGDVLIACVEGTSTYELFKSIPKEILEKYITSTTNLDLYANSANALKAHIDSYTRHDGAVLINKLSRLARTVYMDHYDTIMNYIDSLGEDWMGVYDPLYEKCKISKATYEELFAVTPTNTIARVLKHYISNYDNTDMHALAGDLNLFKEYAAKRTDAGFEEEFANVVKALNNIFASHYETMMNRGYFKASDAVWREYIDFSDVYERCKNGTSSYKELYDLFPASALLDSLNTCIGESKVSQYGLNRDLDALEDYFSRLSTNKEAEISALNKNMMQKYADNYGAYISFDIYNRCADGEMDFYDLMPYMPIETLKMIINTEIEEQTNLDVYSRNKKMLNSYLSTLPYEERQKIKEAINIDMRNWYPSHHVETNNYYRAFIGLPPIDSNGNVYEDTLVHSYDEVTGTFKEFGSKFTGRIPKGIYPDSHWRQPIYEFDSYDIGILNEYNILQDYVSQCGSNMSSERYKYLRYLGDEKLDIYTCRRALNFQLIGVPTIDDTDAKKKFLDAYVNNRDYVIKAVYSDAYKFQSDYYDPFIIIFIMINTMMDMLTGIPELIINREVFDSRCIRYLFESFGIPYYSEIPVKYQKAMLKNLNILIKYKSSTRNMIDICSLFGFSDVRVFGYYLFKQRNVDSNTGEYEFDEDNDISYDLDLFYVRDITGEIRDYNGIRYTKMLDYRAYDEDKYTKLIKVQNPDGSITEKRIINNDAPVYIKDTVANDFIPLKDTDYFTKIKANVEPATLKFIKVPIDEQLTDYKNDPDYISTYDEIVYQDEGDTWDGGLEHEQLRQDILDYEFNAVKSKYISVETVTNMTELSFQVSYFYNMLFDNLYSEDALTVQIPYIKIGHNFRFMDVVCYLFALMYLYNDLSDDIMYSPTQILYIKGYNFNEALNEVLKDSTAFAQEDSNGYPLEDFEKYNIFSENERLNEDGYDYREAFSDKNIQAFNLEADVDALEKWLNDNYQLSLDDFVVDDTLETFNTIITLRSFFSLNNSYYQKDIFKDALLPLPYNQDIKYAFDYSLLQVIDDIDISGGNHRYVLEQFKAGTTVYEPVVADNHALVTDDGEIIYATKKPSTDTSYYSEVIDDTSEEIYIMNYREYANVNNSDDYAIYLKYKKQPSGVYSLVSNMYYHLQDGEYKPLFYGDIGILNNEGFYIFAADNYYTRGTDGTYSVVDNPKYFSVDPYDENKKILNFGQYYVLVDGVYILDPENCYIKVTQNGVTRYVLLKDAENYTNPVVSEDDCYLMHSDGHFIKFTETDYYRREQNGEEGVFNFDEEDCFIISMKPTQYYDPSVSPRVYYEKLSDYYSENNYVVYKDELFVLDPNGNYISEKDLLKPSNCYFLDNTGYKLVADYIGKYIAYDRPRDVQRVLILQENGEYQKYAPAVTDYCPVPEDDKRYVINSDPEFVTILIPSAKYADTKLMIVVLNKDITYVDGVNLVEQSKYNPSKTDDIWDENDWFYNHPSSDPESVDAIGMNGENIWYYRKPGQINPPDDNEEETADKVGSGFYMESTAYIGDIQLEKGSKYYMAFDVETNFSGRVQIYNDADESCIDMLSRVYDVQANIRQHVAQTFIANDNSTPSIKFLIYDFEEYPIERGDYIVVSNIRFIKAYSDNYISQDIPSYDRLQELYRTNEAIYKYLCSLLANCSDYYTYKIYKALYDALMTSKYNKEAFKLGENKYAETYTDFLQTRDTVLYERLTYFKSLDPDAMHKQVADNIIEVTYAIDDCIDTYSYGYLYSYFPAVSANYIQQYITKIINFFKSWKVHLMGINTVYKFDSILDNTIRILEGQEYRIRHDHHMGNVHIHDTVKINPMDDTNVSGVPYPEVFPDLVQYSHVFKDRVAVRDRIRVIGREANRITYTDSLTNLHLILNNDDAVVEGYKDGVLKISHPNAGFKVANNNELIMTTDESDDQAFVSQVLGEINYTSLDLIEWKEISKDE